MPVATFDTLKYANTLKEAGVPPAQAEAQSRALGEALQVNFKELVTKDDLKQAVTELELKLGNRIDAAVAGLEKKIAETSAETKLVRTDLKAETYLLRWMGGIILGVLFAVAVRLFFYMPR